MEKKLQFGVQIRTLVNDCGYSIPTAVKMLTEVPAKILRVNKGVLSKGYDADIIVFNEDIRVSYIFVKGMLILKEFQ